MAQPRILAVLFVCFVMASADPGYAAIIFSNSHTYTGSTAGGTIDINVDIDDQGSFYRWIYTVVNNSYDPSPPNSNGFSGFQLTVANMGFLPDLANQTAPGPGWEFQCCASQVEFDIRNSSGLGIMPGASGEFSFTTNPRAWGNSPGWFHTWISNGQYDVTNFGFGANGPGPEAPVGDPIQPPGVIPEPATIGLLGVGLVAVARRFRKRA